MAYKEEVYSYGAGKKYIEHEIKCVGRFGAKGEKRGARKKATPEQVQKQNQRNREKKVLRKLRANFKKGDLWITLKFPKGTRIGIDELKKTRAKMLRKMRAAYKKSNSVCKFIYREEIGELGGVHIHMVISRIKGPGTAETISKLWKELTGGNVNYTPLYDDGDYKKLADYIVKPPKEEITGQLTLFGTEEEKKFYSKYGCSKNLIEPEPEVKEFKRRTIRKLVKNGPQPKDGYYIDRNSITYGVNQYTGMTYYYYTEVELEKKAEDKWDEFKEKRRMIC